MTSPRPPDAEPPLKHVRLLGGTAIIDLPFEPPRGAHVRVATLWREATSPTGWANQPWAPGPAGRGWTPAAIDLGDVVGFAAEPAPSPVELPRRRLRRPDPRTPNTGPTGEHSALYWYGYLHAVTPVSLTLRGPYPTPHAAYAAAQRSLLAALRPDRPDGDLGAVPVEPAQPPADVTISWHDDIALIGDPHHGWLHTDRDQFANALSHPRQLLVDLLADHVDLDGREPAATLAALAARHIPNRLHDITRHHRAPEPVAAPGPPTPDPAPASRPADARPDRNRPGASPPDPPGPGPPGVTPPTDASAPGDARTPGDSPPTPQPRPPGSEIDPP